MASRQVDEPVRLIEDPSTGDRFLIYGTDKGIKVELRYDGEQLWLSEAQIAELFGVTRQNVNLHLNNVYGDGELERAATCKEILQVRKEGPREVKRTLLLHNLDAIVSVGYRISSKQGTMFRRWATDKLVQFASKGFIVDVERLKTPDAADRVAELREILKDIRSDEANVYREVRSICATCRDYDPKSKAWRDYYARMQAKIVYAVTSKTPSMILMERADADAPNMGLQTWPADRMRQEDVTTSKNDLARGEIDELNRLTALLLDYLDDQLKIGRIDMSRGGGNVKTSVADDQYSIYRQQLKVARHREADDNLADLVKEARKLPKSRSKKKPD